MAEPSPAAVELRPLTGGASAGTANAPADAKVEVKDKAQEQAEIDAEIHRQKLILIGAVKTKVTCSWLVLKRVWRLMSMPGRRTAELIIYWVVALAALALYSWVNYQMSVGGGDFLTILQDFGSLAYSSTNSSDGGVPGVNETFIFTEQWSNDDGSGTGVTYYGPTALSDAVSETKTKFYRTCWEVSLYTFSAAFIFAYILTCSHKISQILRDHITFVAFEHYFQGNVFFEVNSFEKTLDNCDIRLSTDIRLFTYWLSNTLFGTVYYNGVLPTIGAAISFTILLAQSSASDGLAISYLSFLFFGVLNAVIASWTAGASYDMDTANGFYANAHHHLRAHAEHVAFYRGQVQEHNKLLLRLQESMQATATYIFRFFWVNFSTNFYYFLATILNYCLPGLIFFLSRSGTQSPASVGDLLAITAYNSYLQLTFALSIFVTEAWGYTMSYATRVCELLECMEKRSAQNKERETSVCYSNAPHIEFKQVHLLTPDNKTLIKDLSFRVEARQSLIIMGPSGSGKSSALRTICGLWPISSGEIQTPFTGGKSVFFLPQKPYLTLGTLREQFLFPHRPGEQQSYVSDEELRRLLRMVDLEYVLDRFNIRTVCEWANVLSVGEQQRIGMARMFHHRPTFAILDEATSAVDNKMEEKFYTQCRDLGITYISVAHRPACVRYHDALLRFDGKGGYKLSMIAEEDKYKANPQSEVALALGSYSTPAPTAATTATTPASPEKPNIDKEKLVTVATPSSTSADDEKLRKEKEEDAAEVRRQQLVLIGAKKSEVRCDPLVLRRVWRLATMRGNNDMMMLVCWILAVAILSLYAWINYQLSLGGGDFLTQLSNYGTLKAVNESEPSGAWGSADYGPFATLDEAQDDTKRMFYRTCWEVALYTFAAAWTFAMMLSCSHYISQYLREHITEYALNKYFYANTFYEVNNFERNIDNVDIRISNDIRLFTFWLSNTVFGTVYYNGVLPTIAMSISFTVLLAQTSGSIGLWASYISFIVFGVANTLIGSWNAEAAYEMDTDNGFYLNAHSHLRAHAEHIAFYRGQPQERQKLEELLETSRNSTSVYIYRYFFVNFATNFYYWLATILNYCLPGLIFFLMQSEHDPTTVNDLLAVTAYNSYLQLTFALSIFVTEAWAYCMSYATRIGELLDALETRAAAAEARSKQVFYVPSEHIAVTKVSILTPDNNTLLKDLTFKIEAKLSLIIMGPSGSGKSSVLRTMCGLWPISAGEIASPFNTPTGKGVFFLPQKPYLTLGTLREQFAYPLTSVDISDDEIKRLLQMVDLDYILTRFNSRSVADWADILSVGEQQRIGMARMFYQKPTFAILDEATSAVDSLMEEKFYSQCRALGMTYVSVAHRPACIPYHDALLRLDGKGGYTLTNIDAAMKAQYADDPTLHGDGARRQHNEGKAERDGPSTPPASASFGAAQVGPESASYTSPAAVSMDTFHNLGRRASGNAAPPVLVADVMLTPIPAPAPAPASEPVVEPVVVAAVDAPAPAVAVDAPAPAVAADAPAPAADAPQN